MLSFFFKIAGLIVDEVNKELYSPVSIKNQILQLEQQLKEGKISEEEYEERENELLERLEQSQED